MSNHTTIKNSIIAYLYRQSSWCWGGKLAREVARECECKESVVERRCRELVEEGRIEHQYQQVEGKGPNCTQYRIKIIVLESDIFPSEKGGILL